MPTAVVVYDPDGILPSSFARDTGRAEDVAIVEMAADAHRLARDAAVMVLVAGRNRSAALGFLAMSAGPRTLQLVLFASDVRHHRRAVVRASRHRAVVLVGQTPDRLSACIRELLETRSATSAADRGSLR
jgi:hypothetical protein